MPLNDDQLLEILRDQGITDVLKLVTTQDDTRDRASLKKVDVYTKNNKVFTLLEKTTSSPSVPHENNMYKYYSSKDVSIPLVFYNEYDQIELEGIIVMEDLTPTHRNIDDWEVPITPNKLTAMIEVISQFHAVSWGKEVISNPKHLYSTEEYITHIGYLERDYLHFKAKQSFNLGEDEFQIYEKSLIYLRDNAQRHIHRITSHHNTTLIHGDLNVCNMLYPLINNSKPYIIDLEAVRVGLCTEDLVMLFIHDLFHGGEETLPIFEMYYSSICCKITNVYLYDQFVEDIRTSIMEGIFFPLKLFVHQGVEDEELLLKSLNAYKAIK